MLKSSILLNSSVTMLIMIINFAFKVYLAKHFSQLNLVAYYTILDMFALITRGFIGYKDALTTMYHEHTQQMDIVRLFSMLFFSLIFFIALVIIPIGTNYYIVPKIENFSISWIYLSVLFIMMNIVSYYSYLFLITKEYKVISIYDMLKSLLVIIFIVLFYNIFHFEANYQTMIYATIVANLFLWSYLVYEKRRLLPDFAFKNLFSWHLPYFEDSTKKRFIVLTMMASSNYFIYGLLLFAPVFVMLHFQDMDDLANYQVVARSIYFALVAIFSWPLGRFMFPEFSLLIREKRYNDLEILRKKFIKLLIVFGFFIVLAMWGLSEYIITLMFPSSYHDSYKMLNILVMALPFVMYTNFSSSTLKALGNYKLTLGISIVGVSIFIISYYLLESFFIELASIYAFVIAMFSIFLISLNFERKYLDKGELV